MPCYLALAACCCTLLPRNPMPCNDKASSACHGGGWARVEGKWGSRHQRTNQRLPSRPRQASFLQPSPCLLIYISLGFPLAKLEHTIIVLITAKHIDLTVRLTPFVRGARPQLPNPPCPRRLASPLAMLSPSRWNRLCSWRSRFSSQVRLVWSGLVWSPLFLSSVSSCCSCCLLSLHHHPNLARSSSPGAFVLTPFGCRPSSSQGSRH
jgi:hypothetical protein